MNEHYCIKCRKPVPCWRKPCSCYNSCHCRSGEHCNHCFKLRLGGLANGMQFRLQRLIGRTIKFHMDDKTITAELLHVGKDYIEVKEKKSHFDIANEIEYDMEEKRVHGHRCDISFYMLDSLKSFDIDCCDHSD